MANPRVKKNSKRGRGGVGERERENGEKRGIEGSKIVRKDKLISMVPFIFIVLEGK